MACIFSVVQVKLYSRNKKLEAKIRSQRTREELVSQGKALTLEEEKRLAAHVWQFVGAGFRKHAVLVKQQAFHHLSYFAVSLAMFTPCKRSAAFARLQLQDLCFEGDQGHHTLRFKPHAVSI